MASSSNILDIIYFDKDFVFFYGEALDLRGNTVIELLEKSTVAKSIAFKPDTNQLIVNKGEDKIFSYGFGDYIESIKINNILIDSTTLSVAEILLILHSLNQLKNQDISIKILYLEPTEYVGKKSKNDNTNINYELSNNLGGYFNIRPYNLLIDSTNPSEKAEVVVLLGFEDNRLGRIIKFDEEHRYKSYVPLLGLPAFQPGWENITLMKNIRHFGHSFKNIEFTGANNPYQTNNVLERIYANSDYKNVLIAALGTKPCAVGAAIFLVNNYKEVNNNVGIIYDFPIKSKNRTKGIRKIHIYSIEFNEKKC